MKRSNGEGTIYKRKDGRWCGAYYDDLPVPKRHFVYGRTQTEVKKKLKVCRESSTLQNNQQNVSYVLENWILYYLENFKKNELKETTFGTYMETFDKHIRNSSIGKTKLGQLTAKQLQEFYNGKMEDGYSAKTVRHMNVIINSALECAYKMQYIDNNVNKLVILPKRQPYIANILSPQEVARIINNARDEELYPLIILTLYTGLRKGEVMALKWHNVDFQNRLLAVTGSLCRVQKGRDTNGRMQYGYEVLEPKTVKSKRVVPLMDKAVEALLLQRERQNKMKEQFNEIYVDKEFVFTRADGGYLNQRAFMDQYHDFLKRYSITEIRFHDLRHTFASLMLEAGESPKIIQEILGHSTITTTMDIYTHISEKRKMQAIKTFDGVIQKYSEDKI